MGRERHWEQTGTVWNGETAGRQMLGYLNFSAGKPDPQFQRKINEFYRRAGAEPWIELHRWLSDSLDAVRGSSAAFRSVEQAEAVLSLVFDHALPAYRKHHSDLLAHLSDAELFQPFFIACMFEAVLAQGGPWSETERIVRGALDQLNDFIGHRPVAVLENRQKSEPYAHERVRPIPLFIRGAGVAAGKYHELVAQTLEILGGTDPEILAQAHFDLELLDELALDPRAYELTHPVNHRPNYQFGEWDPHQLDSQSRYRRFVIRQVTLDALLERVPSGDPSPPTPLPAGGERGRGEGSAGSPSAPSASLPRREELLFEAAAVLAGTMLMASGTSGSGPDTHDSSVSLETLVPKIARYRDAFYAQLLGSPAGPHGERLRREAAVTHQPFGGARQHLNQFLARQRAAQLQHAHLARMFAQMGYPDATRQQVDILRTASARMLSELHGAVTTCHVLLDRARLAEAAEQLPLIEGLLDRGIACGAIVDPWNILGFQGQFSVFAALENTVPDPRVEELTELMDQIFTLDARLLAEAAATGRNAVEKTVSARFRRLAEAWDRFASVEISGVRRVHGQESFESATHVARALAAWHRGGASTGDIAFWRRHADGFNSPRAYAQVVQALLAKHDYVAAMALLMRWLSQVAEVPLEQGTHAFHALAVHWLVGVLHLAPANDGREPADAAVIRGPTSPARPASVDPWRLAKKFFDFLEANAEEYWQIPGLEERTNIEDDETDRDALADESDEEGDTFAAAYEHVSYRDSAEDGHEGETLEGGSPRQEFYLEFAADRVEPRLRFLTTVAELWQIAAAELEHVPGGAAHPSAPAPLSQDERGATSGQGSTPEQVETLHAWLQHAQSNQRGLARLLDAVQQCPIPQPLGSHDSMVEFDRRRAIKENLIYSVIAAEVETTRAARGLLSALPGAAAETATPQWERFALEIERALARGDAGEIAAKLPQFLQEVGQQPLLYRPLAKGGHPHEIVQAKRIQQALRTLVHGLPRLGLLRETYHVLRTARMMEQRRSINGGITEFDHLFRAGFTSVVESLLDAAEAWEPDRRTDERLLEYLEEMTEPFLRLWLEHSQSLRLSVLERIGGPDEWQGVRSFIETYGHDLFTPKFLTLANLRATLDQGVERYLEYIEENRDPMHPIRLVDELGGRISREAAVRYLELILQTFVENYDEYKDYNATTTYSDYGERYFILFEFLRLKSWYDRASWNLQPVGIAHEVLARKGRSDAAQLWQEAVRDKTAAIADGLIEKLTELQREYGVRMPTIADLLGERFVKPLTVDRIRVLIEPAMADARHAEPEQRREPFQRLAAEIACYAETPTGVGLEVPRWLRVLEHEVRRVRAKQEGLLEPLDGHARLPRARLSLEDLERQLEIWDQPL